MDHDEVVRHQMAEKYLLNELESADREAFEQHFFDCPDCAADVHAGALFVDHSKIVLAETAEAQNEPVPSRPQPGWFAWFRPAFALPAMALLLVVLGYQNLVTIPHLSRQLNTPRVLPFAVVNVGAYGAEAPAIMIHPGEGFLIFARIPQDGAFVRYSAELHDPASQSEWSIAFPARVGQDEYPLQVPGKDWKSGRYALAVFGLTAGGESKEIGKAPVEVQVQ